MKLLEFDTRPEDEDVSLIFTAQKLQNVLFHATEEHERETSKPVVIVKAGSKACSYIRLSTGFMIDLEAKDGRIGTWFGYPVYKDKSIPADCALDLVDGDDTISHTIYLANLP